MLFAQLLNPHGQRALKRLGHLIDMAANKVDTSRLFQEVGHLQVTGSENRFHRLDGTTQKRLRSRPLLLLFIQTCQRSPSLGGAEIFLSEVFL